MDDDAKKSIGAETDKSWLRRFGDAIAPDPMTWMPMLLGGRMAPRAARAIGGRIESAPEPKIPAITRRPYGPEARENSREPIGTVQTGHGWGVEQRQPGFKPYNKFVPKEFGKLPDEARDSKRAHELLRHAENLEDMENYRLGIQLDYESSELEYDYLEEIRLEMAYAKDQINIIMQELSGKVIRFPK